MQMTGSRLALGVPVLHVAGKARSSNGQHAATGQETPPCFLLGPVSRHGWGLLLTVAFVVHTRPAARATFRRPLSMDQQGLQIDRVYDETLSYSNL
eukprot:357938-Chlamydomonas_euryale.AAC.2